MTEEMKEKLIDRIKKLLALAGNNPNEVEAAAAAEKAQELLALHNLSMADVKSTSQDKDEVELQGGLYTSAHPWRRPLGNAVAALYFCKYMYRPYSGKNEHLFIGTKANIAVATMMFSYLFETVDRLAYAGSRAVPQHEKSPYRVAFRAAAVLRLTKRIHDRIRAAKQGQVKTSEGKNLPALLDLYEKHSLATDEFVKQAFPSVKQTKSSLRTSLHSRGSAEGAAAGDSIGLDQQIGSGMQKRIGRR